MLHPPTAHISKLSVFMMSEQRKLFLHKKKQGDGRANRYELSKFRQQFGDTEIQKSWEESCVRL